MTGWLGPRTRTLGTPPTVSRGAEESDVIGRSPETAKWAPTTSWRAGWPELDVAFTNSHLGGGGGSGLGDVGTVF